MPGGTASAQKVAIAERRKMALDLRKQGDSYRQIAESLREVEGVSDRYDHAQAIRDVAEMLRQLNEGNKETAGIVKRLELERLDALHFAHWKAAVAGDVRAGLFILRLMERRARLEGLDAPVTMKHSGDRENPVATTTRSFTIKIDRRADEDLSTIGVLEDAGGVPPGTVEAVRAALVALDPGLATPEAGLLIAAGRDAEGDEG